MSCGSRGISKSDTSCLLWSVGDGEMGSSPLCGKNKLGRWQTIDPKSFGSRSGGSYVDGIDVFPMRRCAYRSCTKLRGFRSMKAMETLRPGRSFMDVGGFRCVT